jgi:ADP-ribose pyrophosphatase YjhB (NUDIX family)
MKFCSNCASPVVKRVPPGDNRPRWVCDQCGEIHYQNPRVVVGSIPEFEGKLLLCRRAIEPRYGYWTLPAGFMEIGETVNDGAIRETSEEAGARIELEGLYSMIDVIHAEQVHVFYRARMLGPELDPGPESLEARLFDEKDIPWDELAFKTVIRTLRWFVADRREGSFDIHTDSILYQPKERSGPASS